MTIVLMFIPDSCAYRAHAEGCKNTSNVFKGKQRRHRVPGTFVDVAHAQRWSDDDESEKAGAPTKANFAACPCTKKL